MAAALVGGAFLSAFLDVVFDRLASPEVANFIRGKKLDGKLLERLDTTLKVVRVVLDDAERKEITDSNVKGWYDDLKDAVYYADDLLDEISTKAATEKEAKASRFFSGLFKVKDREMASKLEDIVHKLETILRLKKNLDLQEMGKKNSLPYRGSSSSLQDRQNVYGRDDDKEAIIKLLESKSGGEGVAVISIVGMGGVGKTTLARLVYNDKRVKQMFNLMGWVSISDEFDVLKVTKIITVALTQKPCQMDDLNALHLELQDKLKGTRFLVVLDDVWIEDGDTLDTLMKPFQCGAGGGIILITTRNKVVASAVRTHEAYDLHKLSEENSWLVFDNHACLSSRSSDNMADLKTIGRKLVKRCNGLPLAAQSLGCMLKDKHDIEDWNYALDSDIWQFPESENKIIPALRVSYHYLPSHLKRCFVYCSLYPKDYKLKKNELILLWAAEDLLPQPKKGRTLEQVGCECFDYLVSRSFIQPSSNHTLNNSFVMHDLMHDLAAFLGGEFFTRSQDLGEKTATKTRHLSLLESNDPISENFEVFDRLKFLRTILLSTFETASSDDNETASSDDNETASSNHDETLARVILSKLKYLRVLSFCGFKGLDVLPDEIGQLIHLRYLDLSFTSVNTLPESLGNLYNLQTLKLHHCKRLTELSVRTEDLVNLCHLDISETSLKEMPRGMGRLKKLQHLDYFAVGKHEKNGIKELEGLSNLHGSLTIRKLENVTNIDEVKASRVMNKKHISSLRLKWSSDSNEDCTDSKVEEDILRVLQPHQNLKLLYIKGYRGTRFPDWFGNSSYRYITEISLSSCKNCWMLPSLGQLPSLKYLVFENLNRVHSIDNFSSMTPFPALLSLKFHNMPCWELWEFSNSNGFPLLEHLEITDCSKLRGALPEHLPALQKLIIRNCKLLDSSLPRAPKIRKLEIVESNKVKFSVQSKCELLASLSIDCSCDSLSSLSLDTFPNLRYLSINQCENLKSLSLSVLQSLQSLEFLKICNCFNLVSFMTEGFSAPSLTFFMVSQCYKLTSLPPHMSSLLPKLHHFQIQNCLKIESFPEGGMPPALTTIRITNCEKLLNSLALLDMLTWVRIDGPCDGIKSFPKVGLLPPSLVSLQLNCFSSLETLDCEGLLHLTSLQSLTISSCPKLKYLPKDMLPSSLIIHHTETPLSEYLPASYVPYYRPGSYVPYYYQGYDCFSEENPNACCIA